MLQYDCVVYELKSTHQVLLKCVRAPDTNKYNNPLTLLLHITDEQYMFGV